MWIVPDTPILIVDTASLYFRAYYGVPTTLTDALGRPVNAVYGLLDMLSRLIDQYSPTAVVCAWDDDWRPQWRVDLVPSYKTHRLAPASIQEEAVEDALAAQVPWIADCLIAAGLCVIGVADYEADDVAGTIAHQVAAAGGRAVIVTGDRDLFQLVGEHVQVAYIARGVARHELVDDAWLVARHGVVGAQYADLATLRGDSSDGLPGVAGIGEKTATTLLASYHDLDGVLAAAADPSSGMTLKQRLRLLDASDYLARARQVVSTADVDLGDWDAGQCSGRADLGRCAELAVQHNVRGPMDRLLRSLGVVSGQHVDG